MKESKTLSFIELFTKEHLTVEIPKIQRDYAQGRKNERTNEIRDNFLSKIKEYLEGEKCFNHLDFIYGDVDDSGKLIVLDGQQRLTTLFLLHWYLALIDERYNDFTTCITEGNSVHFTYSIRQSSTVFCQKLVENGESIFNSLKNGNTKKISEIIEDQTWFLINWKNDLTISSMLVMLDAIQEKFGERKGFYGKLVDRNCIVFNFLPMKEQGLTEELYIKMNSRGRELSRFENLKSKIIGELETRKEYELKSAFSSKIDTIWTDFFWNMSNRTKENHFDSILLNFIEVVFVNRFICNCSADDYESVKKFIDGAGLIPFKCFFKSEYFIPFVSDCVTLLDSFIDENKTQKQLLENDEYFNEKKMLVAFINHDFSDAAYSERLMFFAYCYFIINSSKDIKIEYFSNWMRVIVNIVRNLSPINSVIDFCKTCKSIKEMLDNCHGQDIYSQLGVLDRAYSGIPSSLLFEEKIKIVLINNGWNDSIIEAEKHSYFKGQLKFALDYSGISDLFISNSNYSPNVLDCREKYDYAISVMFSLFDSEGLIFKAKENSRLQRALLAVSNGNYLMSYGYSNRWSFLNDSHRDFSWKNYLQGDNNQEKSRSIRNYFFELIDDELFDYKNLECLELIAESKKDNCTNWVKAFIDYPEILSGSDPLHIGTLNMISFDDDEDTAFILSQMQMNSWHSELFTEVKYIQYKIRETIKDVNFPGVIKYNLSADRYTKPCFFFSISEEYQLRCEYKKDGIFTLFLDYSGDINQKDIDENLKNILCDNEFVRNKNGFIKDVPNDSLDDVIISFLSRRDKQV